MNPTTRPHGAPSPRTGRPHADDLEAGLEMTRFGVMKHVRGAGR
jgi:hypothetical protein